MKTETKRRARRLLGALTFLLAAGVLVSLASTALRPSRTSYGAVWGPFRAEPRDSLDYLWLGSSYAYCDVNPSVIYDRSGLTGYVLAGPEQTLSQTYWYLKEALRTQTPSVILLEAAALHFDRYQNYTQVNVGYMPFGFNKLGAVFTAAEPELRTGLLFDLYFYHSRWKDAGPGELLRALAPSRTDQYKGYTTVDGVFEGIEKGPYTRPAKGEELYQENFADLARIADLCQARKIPLIVVCHPTYSQLDPAARERARADITALGGGVHYLDWTEDTEALGLDPRLHFYDPGHLNRAGAVIFSAWLGDFLRDTLAVSPRRQTEKNAAAWEASAQFWRSGGPPAAESTDQP